MTEHSKYSVEERVKNIENFLVSGMIMITSFVYITKEKYVTVLVNLGLNRDVVLLLLLFILFFSYLSTAFYMFKVAKSSGETTQVAIVNLITSFIEKNKSWLSYPTTGILLIIISVSVESLPGVEWEHIIIALFSVVISIVLLKMHPKLDKKYKGFKSKK